MNILFTSTHRASFIADDLEFLKAHFTVHELIASGLGTLARLPQLIRRSDVTFTWFASVYSAAIVYLAKLYGKKSVIVVGGVDVASFPALGYGPWSSPWKSRLVGYALRNADSVLVVDPYLADEAKRRAAYSGANIEYVPTGYDAQFWIPAGVKESSVLTVAKCENAARMKVKGVDQLLSVAALMPDVAFTLVGIDESLLKKHYPIVPANITIVPLIGKVELRTLYRRAKVYFQPSLVEGLPNSVCEAMLCECIPVATDVGGMKRAVDDAGFLVPQGDRDRLVEALRQALSASSDSGARARQHVARTFPKQRREESLLRILAEVFR